MRVANGNALFHAGFDPPEASLLERHFPLSIDHVYDSNLSLLIDQWKIVSKGAPST
jgi:hypothetical protein